jgi:hypothetical protein
MLWPNTHPFPSRSKSYTGDLMSLSTIKSSDAPSRIKIYKQRTVSSLKTEDIDGAKPLLRGYHCTNKPDYSNFNDDIEKSHPKQLHPGLNKPSFNLMTEDIDKAKPKLNEFVTTRVTNPLNPVYKLASFETRPVTPPKFVRDSISVQDIEGTKPETTYKFSIRDNISVKDIEGARAKPERILTKPDLMNPKDINGEAFQTKRFTNPLEPEYVVRNCEGKIDSIGTIEGSKSRPSIKLATKAHKRNLDSSDIEGARPNTVGLGPLGTKERNYIKNFVDSKDIDGTQSGSHKKGIVTKRITNPLEPKYAWTTEDPADKPLHPKPENSSKPEPVDKEKLKNTHFFWGITPAPSRGNSLQSSRPASSRPSTSNFLNNPGFQKNLYKFYELPLPPSVQQEELNKNTENFYSNSSNKIGDKFISVYNPNTIHRPKKEFPMVEPAQFHQNIKNFCGLSRPASSSGSYKFNLSRADIGKPVE